MILPPERQPKSDHEITSDRAVPPVKARLSFHWMSMSSGLVVLLDLLCVRFTAWTSALVYGPVRPSDLSFSGASDFSHTAWIVAVLAAFILYDKRFGGDASRGKTLLQMRAYVLRFAIFVCVALMLGAVCQVLEKFPGRWLATWSLMAFALIALVRWLAAVVLRRLQKQRVLTEVIAVVGAGPVADRLIRVLRASRPESVELLGIFDDKIIGAVPSDFKAVGSVAQLIELGKTRKIDWILLTLPPTAELRLLSLVQRLKALSVPIALCPQNVGLAVPYSVIDYVADDLPVSLLFSRPTERWEAAMRVGEDYLPRWLFTLMMLPILMVERGLELVFKNWAKRSRMRGDATPRNFWRSIAKPKKRFDLHLDNYDLPGFTTEAAQFGHERFGFVVTPNADHVIRLHDDESFRALYASASYVLLDSRFLSHLLRLTKKMQLPVCTGSDLTAKLFTDVVEPNDRLILIGGSDAQAAQLRQLYGLQNLMHFNPPMGFIRHPKQVESCLQFIEAHSPFRFCFLGVGAPQQETLAQQLKVRGIARGLTLCIGASINFLTGDERRAPTWLQRCGMEWMYRLMQAPQRMATRYLVRGPRVFALLRNTEVVLRKHTTPVLRLVTSLEHLPVAPAPEAFNVAMTSESEIPVVATAPT